jgi:membrane fusion protein (multidrug efflux system)
MEPTKSETAPLPAAEGALSKPTANGNGPSNNTPLPPEPEQARQSPPFVAIIVVAILVVLGAIWGVRFYAYSQTHVSTDDAYVTGDLINISPIIPGTLSQLTVDEGDQVKAGQLIARLDDSGPTAAYQQALAQAQAATSQIPQAQTSVAFEESTVKAQIAQARAALLAQNAKTGEAQHQVSLTQRTVTAQLQQAIALAETANAQYMTTEAQVGNARQAVKTAQAAEDAAEQQVVSAQANATRADRDAQRYASLYGSNGAIAAVTSEQLDAQQAAAQAADASLSGAKDQVRQAQSEVEQQNQALRAAEDMASAAQKQLKAAQANVMVARASFLQVPVKEEDYTSSQAVTTQSQAALLAALAGEDQVKMRGQALTTTKVQALQAAAAMRAAKVTLDDTYISAPTDGTVVRKGVNIGDALTPGQTIVTMTKGNYVWIQANFKETQLAGVRQGEDAEVDIDAFPNIKFKAQVQSVNEASGNSMALLPADNATGNFTKVVQRIPVKLILKPSQEAGWAKQEDLNRLAQGMSVVATIDTGSK